MKNKDYMKVTVLHPETESVQTIMEAIAADETLYRSPHVGNVNPSELQLVLGICSLGGSMQLEMVDTIRGDDSYSNPRVAILGEQTIPLASRNYAKSRVVGACAVDPDGLAYLQTISPIFDLPPPSTLKALHLAALKQAVPSSAQIKASSEFFAEIGPQAYSLVLQEATEQIERPLRHVDADGRILPVDSRSTDFTDIFGVGTNPNQGLLPPLEAMLAIEVIKVLQAARGSDARLTHIAGPDMIRYTKVDEVMSPVKRIAERVLAELGMQQNVECEYVIPCMKTIVESPRFPTVLPPNVRSQFDLLSDTKLALAAL
jgi:hypothetical protein